MGVLGGVPTALANTKEPRTVRVLGGGARGEVGGQGETLYHLLSDYQRAQGYVSGRESWAVKVRHYNTC